MLSVSCPENITALRDGLDVTLVLLGGRKSVPNILGLMNLYAIFVENSYVLLWPTLLTLCIQSSLEYPCALFKNTCTEILVPLA
nr:unnamed protein product [Callosobruchus analis]